MMRPPIVADRGPFRRGTMRRSCQGLTAHVLAFAAGGPGCTIDVWDVSLLKCPRIDSTDLDGLRLLAGLVNRDD